MRQFMTNWYTADPHFGHDNIIKYCHRPFRNVGEMDAVLLANYVSCVGPDDDIWVIGDFGFGRAARSGYLENVFHQIPGRKHLVVGNHDGAATLELPWTSISHLVEIKDGEQRLVLCHYPMITWNGARRGALQLFGHVHDGWRGTRNSVNAGVDVWNFMPVRVSDLTARARTLPVNKHWSEAEHGATLQP